MMSKFEYFFLSIFALTATSYVSTHSGDHHHEDLFHSLQHGDPEIHHRHVKPETKEGSAPLTINTNAYVRDFSHICMLYETLTFEMTLRHMWTDKRLSSNSVNAKNVTLIGDDVRKAIWTPDTFFRNEREPTKTHSLFHRNEYARVDTDGNVVFSSRLTVNFGCPGLTERLQTGGVGSKMKCKLTLASYGYTTQEVVYQWLESTEKEPIQTSVHLNIPYRGVRVNSVTPVMHESDAVTSTGKYNVLSMIFEVERFSEDKIHNPHH